jgi:chlorobactene glucosyltransferase
MYAGSLAARPDAEYLLFVDADTRHDALMLSSVVLRAEEVRTDLLSLVIRVDMESFWERFVVPEIGELYSLLVGTMDSVNRKHGSGAAANGQFMLVRPNVYREVIACPEIRSDVAEDRAIAAALKSQGRTVRLEYGEKLVHARVYSSLREMWAGYSKTVFWASGHNTPRTIGVALALLFYAFAPFLTLAGAYFKPTARQRRRSLVHGLAQILPSMLLRVLVNKRLGVPAVYAFAYPLAVVVGDAILLDSLYRVVSGKGVTWKGRLYGQTRQGLE